MLAIALKGSMFSDDNRSGFEQHLAIISGGRMIMRKGSLWLLPVLAVWGCSSSKPHADAPTFGVYDLYDQIASGDPSVHVADVPELSSVSVRVTVGVDGKVIDAALQQNLYKVDAAPALAAARRLRFKPRDFEGQPIKAAGFVSIRLYPPEIPPDRAAPFPIGTPDTTEITLERTQCFGTCPDYRVSIRGDGRVRFSIRPSDFPGMPPWPRHKFGDGYVLWSEPHETQIDPKAVAGLLERFRQAHFMGLQSDYHAGMTDNSSQILRLKVGGQVKQVYDYAGISVGMPESVRALQVAVDTVAGTKRWVKGNAQTIAELKRQGFNFKSQDAALLIAVALHLNMMADDLRNLHDLITAAVNEGLDLSLRPPPNWAEEARSLGLLIINHAARTGDEALFDMMVKRGILTRMSKAERDSAFASLSGCSPAIAKALAAAGADPKARRDYHDPVRDFESGCAQSSPARRGEMVKTFMALGVHPPFGNDPVIARAMLKVGANPNAINGDGLPPLLTTDDDRVAVLLLRAGADPQAKGRGGSVLQRVKQRNWPAAQAWLRANRGI